MPDLANPEGYKLILVFLEKKGIQERCSGQATSCTSPVHCMTSRTDPVRLLCDREHGIRRCCASWCSGSRKDTQTPRRINISTPSVADVNNAHPYDCCRVAANAPALRRTGTSSRRTHREALARADPDVPHTTLEWRASCLVHQPERN